MSNTDTMQAFYDKVPLLENSDFTPDNKLILDNVKKFTKNPNIDTVIVMVYADWCPHCVHTKPAMVEAVDALSNNKNVIITAIPLAGEDQDKTLGARLKDIFGPAGWGGGIPFIGKIKNGNVTEHDGGRKADDIVKFALK